ncbi:hypothetical protein OG866_08600 [Streptomyces sp. NBC_00663]|uniref:hypothetical protein n=1 Tax=Streptomyces sp. NBC_00663 TaxID=2975801 RepID=UPI002E35C1CE|nr:hypothetical protein [Streptomyces sp. NBC_00663]
MHHLGGVHRRHVTRSSRGFSREVALRTDSLADLPADHGEAIRLVEPGGFAIVRSGRARPRCSRDRDRNGDRAAGPWLRRR